MLEDEGCPTKCSESCSWCSYSVPDKIKYDLQQLGEYRKSGRGGKSTIFRVGAREKKVKPEHFTHEVLSLGLYDRPILYHHVRHPPKTRGESFRVQVVSALLHDLSKTEDDWDAMCAKVVQSPRGMRAFYDRAYSNLREEMERSSEMQSLHYEDDIDASVLREDVVRSVLTLDAVFLACFLGSIFHREENRRPNTCTGNDFASSFPVVYDMCTSSSYSFQKLLLTDIMKLENQIPMSLIRTALTLISNESTSSSNDEMSRPSEEFDVPDGTALSSTIWSDIKAGLEDEYSGSIPGGLDLSESPSFPPHLLGFLYGATRLNFSTSKDTSRFDWTYVLLQYLIGAGQKLKRALQFLGFRWKEVEKDSQPKPRRFSNKLFLPTATQLVEAGIEFCGLEGGYTAYGGRKREVIFKIHKFSHKATLYLPTIQLMTGDTEMLWRNLVAYLDETGHSRKESDNFLAYLEFMDSLIDTEQDVEKLNEGEKKVIVHHTLGSRKAVATVFNSMLSNYTIRTPEKWRELSKKINEHYNSTAVRMIVQIKRTYLDLTKPWLLISVITAALLLVLTFMQTVLTWLSYD